MAGKGGGAWKVAYADFVTAMMAFFLVMWICGQDQKIRQAVSYYFNDPINTSMVGNAKQPSRSGSVAEMRNFGNVPASESVALGHGRKSYTSKGEKSPTTKLVSDWLNWDEKIRKQWEQEASQVKKWAATSKEVLDQQLSPEQAAVLKLAKSLHNELVGEIIAKAKGVQQDLLMEILGQVNWSQIAEDLLGRQP